MKITKLLRVNDDALRYATYNELTEIATRNNLYIKKWCVKENRHENKNNDNYIG